MLLKQLHLLTLHLYYLYSQASRFFIYNMNIANVKLQGNARKQFRLFHKKMCARSVQPFSRLLDTNRQTDKKTDKQSINNTISLFYLNLNA